MQQPQQPQVDLSNTSIINGDDGESILFGQGVILRKVSKFIMGGDEDGIIPIPVFYDLASKKIFVDTLPKEIREEYKDYTFED